MEIVTKKGVLPHRKINVFEASKVMTMLSRNTPDLQEKIMEVAVGLIDHSPIYSSKQEMIDDVENMLNPIFNLTAEIVTEVSSTFSKKKE